MAPRQGMGARFQWEVGWHLADFREGGGVCVGMIIAPPPILMP